jgi:hypothetical protein
MINFVGFDPLAEIRMISWEESKPSLSKGLQE